MKLIRIVNKGVTARIPAVTAIIASSAAATIGNIFVQIPGVYSNSTGERVEALYNSFLTGEAKAFVFGKTVTVDTADATEAWAVAIARASTDTIANTEQTSLAIDSVSVDSSLLDDTLAKIVGIYLSDALVLSESFNVTNGGAVSATDSSSTGEQLIFGVTREVLEIAGEVELLTITVSTAAISTAAAQEVVASSVARPLTETALQTESGNVSNQSYIADDGYTFPGYVGTQTLF